ncbi:MAG: hypothetical protein ABIP88_12115 [Candidatus Binatia bacterium]
MNGYFFMKSNLFPFVLSPSKDSERAHHHAPRKSLHAKVKISRLLFALIILVTPLKLLAQEQILVGYDGHAGFQGAIWATKDLGLFEKHGLAGELILIPGPRRWRRSYAAAMWRWSPRRIINCR